MNKDHIKQLWNNCELDIMDFAKAIRAEALEEAFLVCQQVSLRYLDHYGPDECAAAIKRLK